MSETETEIHVWLSCPSCTWRDYDVECDWREVTQGDVPEGAEIDGIMIAVCPDCGTDLQAERTEGRIK